MTSKTKFIVWHVIIALLAWRLWLFSNSVSFNSVIGFDINLPAVLTFILLSASISLGYVIFQDKKSVLIVSVVTGIIFLIYLGWSWLNLLAVIGFWLFNSYALANARGNMHGRIRLNVRMAMMSSLYPIVIGFFLMFSFAAYQSDFLEDLKNSQRLPSQAQEAIRQFAKQFVGPKVEGTQKQKDVAINRVTNETVNEINSFLKPLFEFAPPFLAFALFLILMGISWIFVWLSMLIGLLVFFTLKKSNFVRIEQRDIKADMLIV